MEKELIKNIEKQLQIIKERKNYPEQRVENALSMTAELCLRLCCIKALKKDFITVIDGKEEFDFYSAIKEKEVEKVLPPLLLAKIKATVERCEKIADFRKRTNYKSFYIDEMLDWINGVVEETKNRVNVYCERNLQQNSNK